MSKLSLFVGNGLTAAFGAVRAGEAAVGRASVCLEQMLRDLTSKWGSGLGGDFNYYQGEPVLALDGASSGIIEYKNEGEGLKENSVLDDWKSGFLFAVPKQKTSKMKKRIRNSSKVSVLRGIFSDLIHCCVTHDINNFL